jgi:hypothetical protein
MLGIIVSYRVRDFVTKSIGKCILSTTIIDTNVIENE